MLDANKKKIKQAVEDAKTYPNPVIEYNFDEEVDSELFGDIRVVENKQMERNNAKIIYKLS